MDEQGEIIPSRFDSVGGCVQCSTFLRPESRFQRRIDSQETISYLHVANAAIVHIHVVTASSLQIINVGSLCTDYSTLCRSSWLIHSSRGIRSLQCDEYELSVYARG